MDVKAFKVHRGDRDAKEKLDSKAAMAIGASRGVVDSRESMAIKALRVIREDKASEMMALKADRGSKVSTVHSVIRATREMLAIAASKDLRAFRVPLEFKGGKALREN